MAYQVVFLEQAEIDLKELKKYILENFTHDSWQASFAKIKELVNALKTFPQMGNIPPELADLNMDQYRQVISGMNRIIYEIRKNTIYIHLICDVRRNMKTWLTRRLLSHVYASEIGLT